ncbi:Serine/Threonine protein kinase [Orpheovirus IHUMI-LCC2]|uniref:Serine/Threonine protein kinase n=1 Tax=Orpheovirus IHUMI-LCC2 TaxID=2023057 RepID=A0A2I2L5G4_9VIRU|nr:Serine/Threonine protein kinase [Orpheovirus IHUMI-LCC2]SNW62795.1 Serine/Threonine protein kinase [Orpheovirus IHUMI-LCC2]
MNDINMEDIVMFPLSEYCEDCINKLLNYRYKYINYLEVDDDGFIFLYVDKNTNREVILKLKHTNIESLKYEYLILNKLKEDNVKCIPDVIEYLENNEIGILVYENIRGIPLSNILQDVQTFMKEEDYDITYDDISILIKQIMYTILELHKFQFTHYNLTLENIIVDTNYEKEIYKYNIYGKDIILYSKFNIKIINYEKSHINGVNKEWCPLNNYDINEGIIPSIFDDLFDMCSIIVNISTVLYIDIEQSNSIMEDNMFEEGVELVQDADNKYGTNMKILDEVLLERFYVDSEGRCDNSSLNDIINICNCLTEYKRIIIFNRKNGPLDLYRAYMRDLSVWIDDVGQ